MHCRSVNRFGRTVGAVTVFVESPFFCEKAVNGAITRKRANKENKPNRDLFMLLSCTEKLRPKWCQNIIGNLGK